jgi:hypothetical protein
MYLSYPLYKQPSEFWYGGFVIFYLLWRGVDSFLHQAKSTLF